MTETKILVPLTGSRESSIVSAEADIETFLRSLQAFREVKQTGLWSLKYESFAAFCLAHKTTESEVENFLNILEGGEQP